MRKSTMLSLFAALLLIAGTVMAQQPDHRSTSGTVLSYTPGEQLVVETDDGQKTFKIVDGTTLPRDEEIEVGDAIVVDWNVGESAQAMPHVRSIRLDDRANERMAARERETMETTETTATTETTTRDTTTRSATEQQRADRTSTRDQDPMGTTSERQETTSQRSTQTRSSLPQTGSNLPLIGLIGLLTLTGAATLTLRR